MKSAPTSCGFDPKVMREVREKLASGQMVAVYSKTVGRILYVTLEELAALEKGTYFILKGSDSPAAPSADIPPSG